MQRDTGKLLYISVFRNNSKLFLNCAIKRYADIGIAVQNIYLTWDRRIIIPHIQGETL